MPACLFDSAPPRASELPAAPSAAPPRPASEQRSMFACDHSRRRSGRPAAAQVDGFISRQFAWLTRGAGPERAMFPVIQILRFGKPLDRQNAAAL